MQLSGSSFQQLIKSRGHRPEGAAPRVAHLIEPLGELTLGAGNSYYYDYY